MAGNNSIKVLRGTRSGVNNHLDETLDYGQPLFVEDENMLYIGTGDTIRNTKPITSVYAVEDDATNGYLKVKKNAADTTYTNIEVYTLPLAASGTRGGVQTGFSQSAANHQYAVSLSSEKAYVDVPAPDGSTGYGVVKTNFTAAPASRQYPVKVSSGSAYAEVNEASASGYGVVKTNYSRSGNNFTVGISSGNLYANVPDATTSASGAMSAIDKLKVNTIELDLANFSWSEISAFSTQGVASSLFAIGDIKALPLHTTSTAPFTTSDIARTDLYAYIIGFDHNISREKSGSHTITFQYGSTSSKTANKLALVDSKYSSSVSGATGYFSMNTSNTNSGGWNNSYMRRTVCPAFKSAMDSSASAVIKSVTKYTDNIGGGSTAASNVTATTEEVFLLSEFEVFGTRSYANTAERNYQAQYAYYANGGAKKLYKSNAETTACIWWLRSPSASNSNSFCTVNGAGNATANGAGNSYGFAPAFNV